MTFVDNGVLRTESKITSYTFLEHETNLNDAKRNINILRQEYLNLFLEEFGKIMEYKPSRSICYQETQENRESKINFAIKKEVTLSDLWRKKWPEIFFGVFSNFQLILQNS